MSNNLGLTLEQSVKYRGRFGQWAWIFHRISGLAVLLFLTIHIVDTSFVYFSPTLYNDALFIYKSVPFGIGEIALMAGVLYHAFNGLRVILLDFWPPLSLRQRQMWIAVWVLFIVTFIPSAYIMGRGILRSINVNILGLILIGGAVAVSTVSSAVMPNQVTVRKVTPHKRTFETWAWFYMRLSGVALLVLAVGHMLMEHILNDVHNASWLWVIDARWSFLWIRVWDFLLLGLAFIHGLNGFHTVLRDYVHSNRAMGVIRALIIVIGGIILLIGATAIIGAPAPK